MTKYELMIVIQGQIPEDLAKEVSSKVKKNIEDLKAKNLKEDFWGRRKLAYEIDHQEHGYYDVFNFDLDGVNVEKLEAEIKLINEVIRFLLVKKTEEPKPESKVKPKKVEKKEEDKVELKKEKKESSKKVEKEVTKKVKDEIVEKVEEKKEKEELAKKETEKKDHLKGLDEKIDEILKD